MNFKNKTDLIRFVKNQTNIELDNDKNILNNKRKILYTSINITNSYRILPLLKKHNIHYESHVGDNYFIYI